MNYLLNLQHVCQAQFSVWVNNCHCVKLRKANPFIRVCAHVDIETYFVFQGLGHIALIVGDGDSSSFELKGMSDAMNE